LVNLEIFHFRSSMYMYSLGIQCKRQNIPDHAFYSYSVLNRSLSYICNISFLEVHLERVATRSDWYAYVVFNRPSPIFCFHIVNLTDPLFHLMKHSQNSRNRCECITLSNAAFASRSTRCPFCFSSVNILYASSTGIAAFMGDDPFVNPLCVGFCKLWINGCILSLITASTILLITGRTVIPR
jgi:hypothetical protein